MKMDIIPLVAVRFPQTGGCEFTRIINIVGSLDALNQGFQAIAATRILWLIADGI
jgi:hypothetical protein